MENPFEIILEKLDRIEKIIENLSTNGPLANANDPMDIKALSVHLKISPSAIYQSLIIKMVKDYILKKKKLMIGYLQPS